MDPNHLATKADIRSLGEQFTALLEKALPALAAQDDFLSVAEVAKLTGTSEKTVRKWLSEGKYDQKGQRIKLFALEFSPGFPRIPRSALVAYGRGLGFDVSHLTPAQLPTMRVAS